MVKICNCKIEPLSTWSGLKGLKTIIFYPGMVYGPGDWNIFGEMLYDIVRGKFLGLAGKGESIGSISYLYDVIEGLVSVVERNDLDGEDFILGGVNITFGDYLDWQDSDN